MAEEKNVKQKTQDLYRDGEERTVRDKAFELGLKYFDLRDIEISKDALSLMTIEEVERYKIVPVRWLKQTISFGTTETDLDTFTGFLNLFKKHFKEVEVGMISGPSFEEVLQRYKNEDIKKIDLGEKDDTIKLDLEVFSFEDLDKKLQEAPIQDMLKMIFYTAVISKSSDIHIEPRDEEVLIRFRIDGILHEIARIDKERYKVVLSQIELKSGIKLGVDYPQQGRFEVMLGEEKLSVRVETIPALYGDDVVIRIFQINAEMLDIKELGILNEGFQVLQEAMARPHGMVIVVGPTGSGKTSTIYSILNKLNTSEVKIITLEDPIEYSLKGSTQSQIKEGESFGDRLKAVLREDPDIIMVGEIREEETAKTALQAALTGHLVITSLHANDSVTAILRLSELTGDASMISAATNVIIAQRLVRKICEFCKAPYEPNDIERKEITRILNTFTEEKMTKVANTYFKGKGCEKCNGIGYKGRVGIFEFLTITPEIQIAILKKAPIFELRKSAIEGGMLTMEHDGLLKCVEGIITISEVMRAIKE